MIEMCVNVAKPDTCPMCHLPRESNDKDARLCECIITNTNRDKVLALLGVDIGVTSPRNGKSRTFRVDDVDQPPHPSGNSVLRKTSPEDDERTFYRILYDGGVSVLHSDLPYAEKAKILLQELKKGDEDNRHERWVQENVKPVCRTCKENYHTTFNYDACSRCPEKSPFTTVPRIPSPSPPDDKAYVDECDSCKDYANCATDDSFKCTKPAEGK